MSYLGGLIGSVLGFVLKLAILALIVNTIGGGWGFMLLSAFGLVIYCAARNLGQPSA
jgi:hypothetical protein